MSIHAEPYPSEGVGRCPTVLTAETILKYAAAVDGPELVNRFFAGIVHWEGNMPEIPNGVGIGKARESIRRLWKQMSKEAKAAFLVAQLAGAIIYADTCSKELQKVIGESKRLKDGSSLMTLGLLDEFCLWGAKIKD